MKLQIEPRLACFFRFAGFDSQSTRLKSMQRVVGQDSNPLQRLGIWFVYRGRRTGMRAGREERTKQRDCNTSVGVNSDTSAPCNHNVHDYPVDRSKRCIHVRTRQKCGNSELETNVWFECCKTWNPCVGKINILLPDTAADKYNAVDVPSHSPSHTKTEECISFGRLANTAYVAVPRIPITSSNRSCIPAQNLTTA